MCGHLVGMTMVNVAWAIERIPGDRNESRISLALILYRYYYYHNYYYY